jgi:hypothetical protein
MANSMSRLLRCCMVIQARAPYPLTHSQQGVADGQVESLSEFRMISLGQNSDSRKCLMCFSTSRTRLPSWHEGHKEGSAKIFDVWCLGRCTILEGLNILIAVSCIFIAYLACCWHRLYSTPSRSQDQYARRWGHTIIADPTAEVKSNTRSSYLLYRGVNQVIYSIIQTYSSNSLDSKRSPPLA